MRCVIVCVGLVFLVNQTTSAEEAPGAAASGHEHAPANFRLIEKLPPLTTTDEHGQLIQVENERRWKLICGSEAANLDQAGFEEIVRLSKESLEGPFTVVSPGAERGGAFNVVFNVSGSPPAGATAALDAIALYYEAQFSDPITVTFPVSFQALGAGILGSTSSDYVNNQTYTTIRTNLQTLLDFDDQIQALLPPGSTCPVRYDSNSALVSNQSTLDVTEANWAALRNIDVTGNNASITISTNFTFDYDPSNGVSGTCFRSVMVHEVGHALGFTSSTDFGPGDMEVMDLYRFQFTDGTGDYNPDDTAEFTARPRLVHNNSPNDGHHSELLQANGTLIEYRMSDGNPNQASHWFQSGNPGIGIMNPTIGSNITYAPNYLRTSDIAMLDAMGWDYPPTDPGDLTPPTPNPMAFSINPQPAGTTAIYMQATLATDVESPPVEYFFDYVSGAGGHDSGWQSSRDYTDTGLLPNSFYNYRVKARDGTPNFNETAYSGNVLGATDIETPVGVSFGATDDTSITVNADGTFTNIGFNQTGFFFEMTPAAGSGANVWVGTTSVTVTGLTPCTQYTFRVKARNFNGNETVFTATAPQSTTGCTACLLLGDMNSSGGVDGEDLPGFVRTKLGTPIVGDSVSCADYATGTLDGDIAEFVDDLLAP